MRNGKKVVSLHLQIDSNVCRKKAHFRLIPIVWISTIYAATVMFGIKELRDAPMDSINIQYT